MSLSTQGWIARPLPRNGLWQRCMAEALGTFFLVFNYGVSGDAFAGAFTRLVMSYCFVPISDGHFNPALTLCAAFRGAISWPDAMAYTGTQYMAGLVAGAIAEYITSDSDTNSSYFPRIDPKFTYHEGFSCEFLASVVFFWVYLITVTSKKQKGNHYYGLALGFAHLGCALTSAPVTGGTFNPAIGTLLAFHKHVGRAKTDNNVHFLAPYTASIVTIFLFNMTNPEDLWEKPTMLANWFAPLVTELLGTLFLVYIVSMTVNVPHENMGPMAVGGILAAIVYAGGPISGGQFNPAVTIACFLREMKTSFPTKEKLLRSFCYMTAQMIGGFIGAGFAVSVMHENAGYPTVDRRYGVGKAFFAELIGTMALVTAVMFTATVKLRHVRGNPYFGVAIGFALGAVAWSVAPIGGGAFNPIVGMALTAAHDNLVQNDHAGNLSWIYYFAPCLGGIFAVMLFFLITAHMAGAVEGTNDAEEALALGLPAPEEQARPADEIAPEAEMTKFDNAAHHAEATHPHDDHGEYPL